MLEQFVQVATQELLEKGKTAVTSPRKLAAAIADRVGMEAEDVQKLFEDPAEAQQFLGKRYLRLSSLLADCLEGHIEAGELTPSDVVKAIPVVSKTARLFLGESTVTVDSPTQALLEALEEKEDNDGSLKD